MSSRSTQSAILTPPGRAAVATVRIRGERAVAVVDQFFQAVRRKSLTEIECNSIVFGRFHHDGVLSEELVVVPLSATCVEIHCHGGEQAATAIQQTLVGAGVEAAAVEDVCRGELSRFQSQALHRLSNATTERTAAILLDQVRGAFVEQLKEIALLCQRQDPRALEQVLSLMEQRNYATHLIEPWKVVLAGPPNVGKSSLINALLGFERSIVFAVPGTTRDVVTAIAALDGWPVEFSDTAGIRASDDSIEQSGIERAQRTIQSADLVLWLNDVSAPQPLQDKAEYDVRCSIDVWNKSDLATAPADDGCACSAKTGAGLAELRARISQTLVPHPLAAGDACPCHPEQFELLADIQALLEQDCFQLAAERLVLAAGTNA